jgi:hypothetical protein
MKVKGYMYPPNEKTCGHDGFFSTQGHAPCFFLQILHSWRKKKKFCLTHGCCVCATIFL